MNPEDDTLAAHLYRVSAMDYAWHLVQTRHREWLGNKSGNAPKVVTKAMVAEWCGVPVEQVTIKDGEFRIALNPVSQWCCTVPEADDANRTTEQADLERLRAQ